MVYALEYYAVGDDRQPAEDFEDRLKLEAPRLLGKLHRVAMHVAQTLPGRVGGGLFEKCRGYPDLYEIRTIFGKDLARLVVALDAQVDPRRLVLLHGFVKRRGQATPKADLDRAARYWNDYLKDRRVSPNE